jgi:glycogen debranching enzyme
MIHRLRDTQPVSLALTMAAEGLAAIASGEQLLASSRQEAFGRLFGRDSLITSLQFISAVRLEPSLAPLLLPPVVGSLRALASMQGVMEDPWTEEEPGKILHEMNSSGGGDFPGAYYASMDSTPLFLIALHQLAALPAGASHLLTELRDARDRALTWITKRADLDGDGLVEYLQRNPERKSLINQNWKDSRDSLLHADGSPPQYPVTYCEVQAYCYNAVMGEALLRRDEAPEEAEALGDWAEMLAHSFERRFWVAEGQYYAQALDAGKGPLTDVASNGFHWLWLGPLRPRRFRWAARRMLAPDMMTPYGLRTLSADSPNYAPMRYHRGTIWPWDNWAAATALRRIGMRAEAATVDSAVMTALTRLGHPAELYVYRDGDPAPSTELLDVWGRGCRACRIQAWTVGYLVEMLARAGAGPELVGLAVSLQNAGVLQPHAGDGHQHPILGIDAPLRH